MRLVQPATVPAKTSWVQGSGNKPLLKALNVIQTGFIEFGNGALPEALLRFINCRSIKVFGSIRLRVSDLGGEGNRQVTLSYLVRQEQEESLRLALSNWDEQPLFLRLRPASTPKNFCFCIDEGEESFFWVSAQGKELLERALPVSARTFALIGRVRPTATTLDGILNRVTVVEDHYTRMENERT